MSRKTVRTKSNKKIKRIATTLAIALSVVAGTNLTSCGGDDNEPENPTTDTQKLIIGKWQKYQYINDDGTVESGDLDEFWIFEENGVYKNEDGGNLTSLGNYKLDNSFLTISSYLIDEPSETENMKGIVEFENGYMTYQYTYVGENDYTTYRFRKI